MLVHLIYLQVVLLLTHLCPIVSWRASLGEPEVLCSHQGSAGATVHMYAYIHVYTHRHQKLMMLSNLYT